MQVLPSDFLKRELKGIPPVQLLNWGIFFLPAEGHNATFTMEGPLAQEKANWFRAQELPIILTASPLFPVTDELVGIESRVAADKSPHCIWLGLFYCQGSKHPPRVTSFPPHTHTTPRITAQGSNAYSLGAN